ncbi:MAG: SMEK domain-containing protein [Candidatus Sericytochromatia bacterium]
MITRKSHIDNIAEQIAYLKSLVESYNALSLFDVNKLAEGFYKDLLNLAFDYQFKDANIVEPNAAAIDLTDEVKRIAIQVTSDNDADKIKYTISKFIEKKLYEKYDSLHILILVNKKGYTTTFDSQGKFKFGIKENIFDVNDLLACIRNKANPSKLESISNFLSSELNLLKAARLRTQSTEVETIFDLISYLSENKQHFELGEDDPDPHRKFEVRFAAHTEFLKELYSDLLSIYLTPLGQASKTIGIDILTIRLINYYLKDLSVKHLEDAENNPRKALDTMTDYFESQLQEVRPGYRYDKSAIKFYLLNEVINCSVFPNPSPS